MQRSDEQRARGLAAFLIGAGTMHFTVPAFYDSMIPAVLPGAPRTWTYGSGVVEIATGVAVAGRPTRRLGALAAAVLFAAVFPANLKMAIDARDRRSRAWFVGTLARLPLQAPLVVWAVRVRRGS